MIFSRRGRGGGRHARAEEPRHSRAPRHAADRRPADEPEPEVEEDGEPIEPGPGPYDVAEAPVGVTRLDLGSLQIPAIDDVEVRVQASPEGVIQQVVLVHGDSALQLGVFAAPRSEGIWAEVRDEIRQSLAADGVSAEETRGEYGPELRARVRTRDGWADLRFLGIDGPRWMVRGIYQGPAAVNPAAAGPLDDCLAGLVVDRGPQAMPVKDPLPLRLPRDLPGVDLPAVEQPAGTPVEPPGLAPPGLAPPGLAPPGLAPPGLAPPGLAPPGLAPPGLAMPGVEQPGVEQPGVEQTRPAAEPDTDGRRRPRPKPSSRRRRG